MNDAPYKESLEMFGKEYADALRKVVHSGGNRELRDFLKVRQGCLKNTK